ncbi:hypothetical protein [Persicitalea jodogahamensis]|uniref:Uncharacterized protein n=1 Tax=Persicitalea jodogahamensis TaxID=402147 RepID=A0A8J3D7Z3_9BACT|nr:hypothetical protein [Persicitalea jodogahamensis]GHB63313.1 hypothetical protein GCM10007390_16430 [Persicitalea jodogahamensis]
MSKTRNRLLLIFGLLPVVLFIFVVVRYSVNVPWFDDFDPFPDFLRKWILSEGFSEKIKLLFQPNNEHRMVFGKGIAVAYYAVTGELNFTFLHIAGMVFTLGTLLLIWKAFRWAKLPPYFFLPVPFLLFQLQYHLIFLWAICSLQHQPVVFFVCLSMFLLAKNRLGLAILAALCANFAMSNGIFVWVGGAGVLLFQTRYRGLVVWLLSGAVAVALYFSGMSSLNNESSLGFFFQNPHLTFLGFFAFLGGLFDLVPDRSIQVRTALPILMGMMVMIWVAVWLLSYLWPWLRRTLNWTKKVPSWVHSFAVSSEKSDGATLGRAASGRTTFGREALGYFCLGIMLFLLTNAGVIALLRPRFGFFVMVVSNYKIYPALFLVVSYLAFVNSTEGRWQKAGFKLGLAVSVVIYGLTFIHYGPSISERRKYLLTNAYNQEHHGFGLGHVPGSPQAIYVDSLMQFMTERQIYNYPDTFEPLARQIRNAASGSPDSLRFTMEKIPQGLLVTEPGAEIPAGFDSGAYVFLRNRASIYIFKLNQRPYSGRNVLKHYAPGLETVIPYEAFPSGTYDWGILFTPGPEATGRSFVAGNMTLP